jgi:hypothetical protein
MVGEHQIEGPYQPSADDLVGRSSEAYKASGNDVRVENDTNHDPVFAAVR